MLDTKQKRQFIKLRAQGASYEKIIKAMHISRETCQKLKHELADEIDEAKQEELKSLADEFHMVRTARIRATGKLLQKLDAAIDEADFSKVTADKLLALRLQYVEALQKELAIPRRAINGCGVDDILDAYINLLNDSRAGNITGEQALKENSILQGMLKAVDTMQLKARLEEIEKMLDDTLNDGRAAV